MTYLSTSERERLAYAEGYPETAALLARLDDVEAARDALETDLEYAADNAADKLSNAEGHIDELEDELIYAREKCDEFEEQAKTYRAALMALESEVSFGMRDFIREVLG
jgi:chromosome segregation ATPase